MAKRGRMPRGHSKRQFRAGSRVNKKNYQTSAMRGGIRL